jgi:hypothetical protein
MRFRLLLVALVAVALLAPATTASAQPAAAGSHATATKKAKACKRKKGESKKRWLKRCKCKSFKRGETRRKFKKRCPGAKVPKRKAPSGGGTPPTGTPPATGGPAPAPTQSDVEKVTAALQNTQLQYFSYSNTSGASDDERYRFCGTTFQYTRNRIALSGAAYDTNGTGTWSITAAQVNPDGVSGTATLHYVLTSYQSNDVDPAPPSEGDVPVSFNGSKVDFGGRVYDATKITC